MGTSVASVLDRRIDADTWPLAVGDLLAIAAVLTAGTIQHNGVPFVTGNPLYLAGTLAPFVIGWVLVAPLVGAYSPGAGESAKAAVPLALRSWVVADVVGVAIRASPLFHGGWEPIFVAVTLVTGGVALGVWRTLFFRFR
jgi:hypothetical protein